jgi:predicted transcriptional regulator
MRKVNYQFSVQWPKEVAERRARLGWSRYRLGQEAGVAAETVAAIEERRSKRPRRSTIEVIERALADGERIR